MKASISIANELRDRIARGELRPGDPLPSEKELTDDLGYSKPTVREALRILENDGLISVKRGVNGGPEVRRPSIAEVVKPMGVYLQIGDVAVTDVWESRDRIIRNAIERLGKLGADADLDVLDAEVDRLTASVGDLPAFYPNLIATEETTVGLAGNTTDHVMVIALRHVVAVELAAATAAVKPEHMDTAVAAEEGIARGWRALVDHLRAGDPAAARAAFDVQAELILGHLRSLDQSVTVSDAVSTDPAILATAHAEVYATQKGKGPADLPF